MTCGYSQSQQPAALNRLIDLAKRDRSTEVRKQALFWLGQSQDARALEFYEQVPGQ